MMHLGARSRRSKVRQRTSAYLNFRSEPPIPISTNGRRSSPLLRRLNERQLTAMGRPKADLPLSTNHTRPSRFNFERSGLPVCTLNCAQPVAHRHPDEPRTAGFRDFRRLQIAERIPFFRFTPIMGGSPRPHPRDGRCRRCSRGNNLMASADTVDRWSVTIGMRLTMPNTVFSAAAEG